MVTIVANIDDIKLKALEAFKKEFAENADICVCAPGRVNLIGEHTDYNEGFVLPMALPMVTVVAGKRSNTKKCKIISLSETLGSENWVEFELITRESIKPGEPKWANYVKGCIAHFVCDIPAFNAVVVSSVPVGAGLSSSAALEVATYTFLEVLTGLQSKPEDKALACQRAEHDFAKVPCGIMDQFISVMGKVGYALLLDCRDLTTKQIPMSQAEDYVFLITNSNTPHKLSSSAYCERRESCYQAAHRLNKKSLRELSVDDIQVLQSQNVSEDMIKRTRHVVTEIQRTIDAAVALEKGDFDMFGKLMNESHDSLRDDYEVSSVELDTLVSAAREMKGVLGSRLIGAGFGGCTVTLLQKNVTNEVISHIKSKYPGQATFYIAQPTTGARILYRA
ncbi:PREDICTED: galactokinase-like [Dufourea novaeangliae]|uniref:Galactokinase n=1 Tax=Dufourea novaeangliae TaxID=178035 RepID=A0A154P9H5_DUFNO|nr:PREDICTED: galactokinase-like [Dufourea novaeangliae]KZC08586.1 Galactokinase [Dufourea novaeangliae]